MDIVIQLPRVTFQSGTTTYSQAAASMDRLVRQTIAVQAVEHCDGNISAAARLLRMDRKHLYDIIKTTDCESVKRRQRMIEQAGRKR